MNRHQWVRSIKAAFISGAAGGVLSAFGATVTNPSTFNIDAGLLDLVRFASGQTVIFAIVGVAGFLQKSPLADDVTDSVTVTASPSGTMSVTATHTESGEQP